MSEEQNLKWVLLSNSDSTQGKYCLKIIPPLTLTLVCGIRHSDEFDKSALKCDYLQSVCTIPTDGALVHSTKIHYNISHFNEVRNLYDE